jgi:hypothetical protein
MSAVALKSRGCPGDAPSSDCLYEGRLSGVTPPGPCAGTLGPGGVAPTHAAAAVPAARPHMGFSLYFC